MSGRYAAKTDVSSEKTRSEIERTLTRYGASSFAYAMQPGRAMVMFEANGRRIRFVIPLPDPNADRFAFHARSVRGTRVRTPAQRQMAYEQETRSLWRALLLVVKAKLEAVEAGITTFDDEFLAHIVLMDGRSFGEWARQDGGLAAIDTGVLPPMLPGGR